MAGNLVQGALFTVMVVRAGMLRDSAFNRELAVQIERSPRFFQNAPVVLDLRGTDGFAATDAFAEARDLLRAQTLTLVGVQNAEPAQLAAAAAAGLASFAPTAATPSRRVPQPGGTQPGGTQPDAPSAPPGGAPSSETERQSAGHRPAALLVTAPVRSGTQVYARGTDLIVTTSVSPGAEVVADGNIHVYGPLRGRALAGASGDANARIFCSRLEAELVSIAGRYLVNEQLPPEHHGFAVQIALTDDQLSVSRS